jgi:hypothetical protein
MPPLEPARISASWRRFLIDLALARDYQAYFGIAAAVPALPPRNPVLDQLLPGLLHMKALTILDVALKHALAQHGTSPKKALGLKDDLHGRIETAAHLAMLPNAAALHVIRDSRNDIAHDVGAMTDWEALSTCVLEVNTALQSLGLTGELPKLSVSADRSPSDSIDLPGVAYTIDYTVFVKEGSSVWATVTWTEHIPSL